MTFCRNLPTSCPVIGNFCVAAQGCQTDSENLQLAGMVFVPNTNTPSTYFVKLQSRCLPAKEGSPSLCISTLPAQP